MTSNALFALVVAIASAIVVAGCDRQQLQQLPAEAERQVERIAPMVDDATVTARVKGALVAAPDLSGLSIDVDTSGNVVTLNGTVSSAEQRDRAANIARAVEGVADVTNNLSVKQ